MRIPDLYAQPEPTVSFEFFPPKNDEAEAVLFQETVPALKQLSPAFISVTYGAGGGTRDRSLRIVSRLIKQFGIEAMPHLTCVGATADFIGSVLDEAAESGAQNLLCLRGDPPKGETTFTPTAGGFAYAIDLIRYVKARTKRFAIGAACYPEGHIECANKQLDWDRTADKVEAGAEYLITQLFYDIDAFLAFEDYLRNKRGIKVPIVPGVLPFLGAAQIRRFTSLCGAKIPESVSKRLDSFTDDESVRQFGVEVCTEMCRRLLDHGVAGIHLYCLNRAASTTELLHNLGLVKKKAASHAAVQPPHVRRVADNVRGLKS